MLIMRGLVQRVTSAAVDVRSPDGTVERVGEVGPGLCVLVGAGADDDVTAARRLAEKVWFLRVLADADGAMNRSLADVAADGGTAAVLVVSQFTLYGDTRKGRRPSFVGAAPPDRAEPLVDEVAAHLRQLGAAVATGRFRTDMAVSLVNDGPVTLLLEV